MKCRRVYQNDIDVDLEIRQIGCFFRCAAWVAEETSGKTLKAEELNFLWKEMKNLGFLDSNSDMHLGAAPVITFVLNYLGETSLGAREVGIFKHGEFLFYGGEKIEFQYLIQKIVMTEDHDEDFHYRIVNYKGDVIFDPYFPAIVPEAILYSILFSIVNEE